MQAAKVRLTWYQYLLGIFIGALRTFMCKIKGIKDAHSFKGDGWEIAVEGACAEYAFAKYVNVNWDASVNTFKTQPDFQGDVQIKSSKNHYLGLIIRNDTLDHEKFVLVTGTTRTFFIRGWYYAGEAKKHPEWYTNLNDPKRPYVHCVPIECLNPVNEAFIEEMRGKYDYRK